MPWHPLTWKLRSSFAICLCAVLVAVAPFWLAAATSRLSHRDHSLMVRKAIVDLCMALAGSAVARGAGEPPGKRAVTLSDADRDCSKIVSV